MSSNEIDVHDGSFEYVGFWVRLGANLIDSILMIAIIIPVLYLIYGKQVYYSDDMILGTAHFVISYVLPFIAITMFWVYKSATPGKMALSVKIVDAVTGEKPTIGQAIIRYIGLFISSFVLGLGCLWVAWDPKKQGWHDKMASTVVIRPRSRGVEDVKFSGGSKQ